MIALTTRQQEVLDCIKRNIAVNGYAPTVRELGTEMGLTSTSTVHDHLHALEKKGFIQRKKDSPRAIKVVQKPFEQVISDVGD